MAGLPLQVTSPLRRLTLRLCPERSVGHVLLMGSFHLEEPQRTKSQSPHTHHSKTQLPSNQMSEAAWEVTLWGGWIKEQMKCQTLSWS